MSIKVIIAIIFTVIILIFSIQNSEATSVEFLVWSFTTSRVLIILGSFLIGLLCGLLIAVRHQKLSKSK